MKLKVTNEKVNILEALQSGKWFTYSKSNGWPLFRMDDKKRMWRKGDFTEGDAESISHFPVLGNFVYIAIEDVPEPLNLGPEHVGRRVKLRDGDIRLITGFSGGDSWPILCGGFFYTNSGVYSDQGLTNMRDIVEVLI